MDSPICPQHALDVLPGGQIRFLHLDDEVQHRDPRAIRSLLFAQGGSHQFPVREALADSVWQSNEGVHFAPVPDSCRVWRAEPEPRHPLLEIKSQSIGLAFCAAIVAGIRQHADFQEWKWLEL